MNRAVQLLLKAISEPEEHLDVIKSRQLMNLKALDPLKRLYRTLDTKIYNGDHEVRFRIYFPCEESYESVDLEHFEENYPRAGFRDMEDNTYPVILYIHGGGFATESVESYNRVCWNLAKNTDHVVVSIDYDLAPEFRFPRQVEDCYAVARAVFTDRTILHVNPDAITIAGDSAGGNLTAALCQMARDRKEFMPRRQILIYPCLNSDYSLNTPYRSVVENGTDYLLTRQNMEDYLYFYRSSEEDGKNPYFAPLMAEDYRDLPRALVITGEFDPLRDEGEEYARRLAAAGVDVTLHRLADAVHGFFLLPPLYPAVREVYGYINEFLSEDEVRVSDKENQVADT